MCRTYGAGNSWGLLPNLTGWAKFFSRHPRWVEDGASFEAGREWKR
jgi:hypothetical protein